MSIFHSIEFDGVNSLDNDVYVTGEAAYNAPERAVEMVTIPGRNGAFALDQGTFENIEVRYPAGMFGNNQAEFSQKMRSFRNLMKSKVGYKRLVDDYNPDEYRLAIFKDVIEVAPVGNSKAGEFELVFECQPQRYLMSGEPAVDVATSSVVTNPTLFNASPLIETKGYGTLSFNGYTISIQSGAIGTVTLWGSSFSYGSNGSMTKEIKTGLFKPTDTFSFDVYCAFELFEDSPTITNTNANAANTYSDNNDGSIRYSVTVPCMFTISTTSQRTNTSTYNFGAGKRVIVDMVVAYNADTGSVKYTVATSTTGSPSWGSYPSYYGVTACNPTSTLDRLGDPTYIDCDLGEAYKIENGEVIGLNSFIDLGSDLPVLAPGSNTVEYDNTFTSIKIAPRWWNV